MLRTQARFTEREATAPDWQIIHREADRVYPRLRRQLLDTFGTVQQRLPRGRILDLLTQGDAVGLAQVLNEIWADVGVTELAAVLTPAIQETLDRAAEAMVSRTETLLTPPVPGGPGVSVAWDVANPRTLAWIEQHVGAQVQGINTATQRGIQTAVRQSFLEGRGPQTAARDIRQMVGLTTQQTEVLAAYRHRLEQAGTAAARTNALVERKAQQALRRRAATIARHESIAAASAGQHQLWEEAEQQGLWDDDRIRRFWIVTLDDRLCPICRPIPSLNPEGRRLHEPFVIPNGSRLSAPAHVICRCAVTARSIRQGV